MLQNAYFLAKIGADTAENEQDFAEILRKWQLPYGCWRVRARRRRVRAAEDGVLAEARGSGARPAEEPPTSKGCCLRRGVAALGG